MGWVCVLGGVVAVVGCKKSDEDKPGGDGPGEASTAYENGSRLEFRYWTDGNVRMDSTLFDTELGVPCSVSTAEDKQVCRPYNNQGETTARLVFEDADCTMPVAQASSVECGDVGKYLGRYARSSTCGGGQVTTYEIGDEIDVAEAVWELDYEGDCVESTPGTIAFEASEVDVDTLAEVETERVEVTDGIFVEMRVGSDGFRQPFGLYDAEREAPCFEQQFGAVGEDASSYCLPTLAYADAAGYYGYADDACSELIGSTTSCETPGFVVIYREEEGCYTTELFEAGDELELDEVYFSDTEGCATRTESTYETFVTIGEPADLSTVPELERVLVGEGRLQAEYFAYDGNELMPTGLVFDSEFGQTCYPRAIGSGTYCIPSSSNEISENHEMFADEACSVPLVTRYAGCGSADDLSFIGIYAEGTGCGGVEVLDYYEAEEFTGTSYYFASPGEPCMEAPVDAAATYYQVGEVVDPDDVFVSMTLVD